MSFANWLTLTSAPKTPATSRQSSGQPWQKIARTSQSSIDPAMHAERRFRFLVGKTIGHIEARLRAVEGEVRDAVALPADDDIAIAIVDSGSDYQNAVKQPGHGKSRPWVYAFATLVRTPYARTDLPKELKEALETFMTQYNSPKKAARVIRHCTAKLQRKGKFITITIHVRSRIEPL